MGLVIVCRRSRWLWLARRAAGLLVLWLLWLHELAALGLLRAGAGLRWLRGRWRWLHGLHEGRLHRLQVWLRVNVGSAAHRVVAHRGSERVPCGQPVVRMGGAVRDYPALTPHTCSAIGAERQAGAP